MQHCIHCGKLRFWSSTGKFVDGRRQMICRNCGTMQLEVPPQGLRVAPKILYFDIETSLMDAEIFSRRVNGEWLRTEQLLNHWYVITWAAAWIDSSGDFIPVMSDRVREDEARARDDKRCLTWLWNLMEEADYIAGHNSDRFDVKKAHYRFAFNGMGLPYKSKQIDTLKQARKYFSADDNTLEEWSKLLGGDGKKHMEYEDWSRINRDPTAEDLEKMQVYCRQDVREGAKVFREFRRLIEGRGDVVVK